MIREKTYLFDNWIDCRNESVKLMEQGFSRHPCREGFVMSRKSGNRKEIKILKINLDSN